MRLSVSVFLVTRAREVKGEEVMSGTERVKSKRVGMSIFWREGPKEVTCLGEDLGYESCVPFYSRHKFPPLEFNY